MNRFSHILITRFNLSQRWNSDKRGNPVLDDEWLQKRFYLFENFCLPSVGGQSTDNFEWWVYFDVNTPETFRDRIKELKFEYFFFKPQFEKSYDDFERNMPIDLHNYLKKINVQWLITTRLDNDDMLAKNTIEILQKNIVLEDNCILEIPCGYTLELNSRSKLRKLNSKLNPFISYLERVKKKQAVRSVYHHQHTEWRDVKIIIVTEKPQWVQIIHDKNVFNTINGELVWPKNLNSRFVFNNKAIDFEISIQLLADLILRRIKFEPIIYIIRKLKTFGT